jgi:flavin-dependent dehydrogenase
MTRSYDLVVIGAGPAGESAAELAAFLGHSVVIVENKSVEPGESILALISVCVYYCYFIVQVILAD